MGSSQTGVQAATQNVNVDPLGTMLQEKDDTIKQKNTELAEANEVLQRAKDIKAMLLAAQADRDKSCQALKVQRETAEKLLKEAKTTHDGLKARLEKQEHAEMRQKVEEALGEVQTGIDGQQQATSALEEQLKAAVQAHSAAEDSCAEAEKAYQAAKTELQQLSARLADASQEVARILGLLQKAAADGKRDHEVWWRILDLDQSIKKLEELLDQESSLIQKVNDAASNLADKRDAAAKAKFDCARRQAEWDEAQKKLKEMRQQREADVQKALDERFSPKV